MADALPGPGDQPIRRLEGWVTLPEIGETLGVSKQAVHSMVFEYATFAAEDMRFVGRESHAMYLVRESAFQAELDRRERATRNREEARQQAEAERAEEVRTIELRREMRTLLGEAGVMGKDVRIAFVSETLGRDVDDWYNRDAAEAAKVIARLKRRRS